MNKPTPPPEPDDDAQAFRRAMADVARLKTPPRVELRTGRPAPLPQAPFNTAAPNKLGAIPDPWADITPLKGRKPQKHISITDEPTPSSQNLFTGHSEFAQLFGPVHALKHAERLWLESPKPLPHAIQRDHEQHQVMSEALSDHLPWVDEDDTGDELLFLRPGVSRDVLRKLRRGHWVVQAEIDFHGNSSDEARERCGAFLRLCLERALRCVRMVHGKGLSSYNREPVLKPKLKAWLIQRDDILAFCPARPFDGGNGAVIVLLRPKHPAVR